MGGDGDETEFIGAIRALDMSEVERRLAEGLPQRHLDCGLHEIATGERAVRAAGDLRLRIAERLVECGADPDNRQHGCGGTPLHHSLAGGYIELVKFLLVAKADVNASNRYGVHPLHIAVKREYVECIEYLMQWDLPPQKIKEELAWAVQYDLARSVFALLDAGAPHGMRVLTPWSAALPRAQSSWDFSIPLGYYVTMRGWRVPKLHALLTQSLSPLQLAIVRAGEGNLECAAAVSMLDEASAEMIGERSKPYQLSLLHLAVYSGAEQLLRILLSLEDCTLTPSAVDFFQCSPLACAPPPPPRAVCRPETGVCLSRIPASA